MDDISRAVDSYIGELERFSALLVGYQLNLERQLSEICSEYPGGSRSSSVQDFIDFMGSARSAYSDAGELIWQAKEKLEGYRSSL